MNGPQRTVVSHKELRQKRKQKNFLNNLNYGNQMADKTQTHGRMDEQLANLILARLWTAFARQSIGLLTYRLRLRVQMLFCNKTCQEACLLESKQVRWLPCYWYCPEFSRNQDIQNGKLIAQNNTNSMKDISFLLRLWIGSFHGAPMAQTCEKYCANAGLYYSFHTFFEKEMSF